MGVLASMRPDRRCRHRTDRAKQGLRRAFRRVTNSRCIPLPGESEYCLPGDQGVLFSLDHNVANRVIKGIYSP